MKKLILMLILPLIMGYAAGFTTPPPSKDVDVVTDFVAVAPIKNNRDSNENVPEIEQEPQTPENDTMPVKPGKITEESSYVPKNIENNDDNGEKPDNSAFKRKRTLQSEDNKQDNSSADKGSVNTDDAEKPHPEDKESSCKKLPEINKNNDDSKVTEELSYSNFSAPLVSNEDDSQKKVKLPRAVVKEPDIVFEIKTFKFLPVNNDNNDNINGSENDSSQKGAINDTQNKTINNGTGDNSSGINNNNQGNTDNNNGTSSNNNNLPNVRIIEGQNGQIDIGVNNAEALYQQRKQKLQDDFAYMFQLKEQMESQRKDLNKIEDEYYQLYREYDIRCRQLIKEWAGEISDIQIPDDKDARYYY